MDIVAHDKVTDSGVGVLLTVAGWTGGGVLTGIALQVLRAPAGAGAFPPGRPLDAFYAVVAGCLLVGPVVAGALLWRWRQPRPVGTVAILCGVAVVGAVPLMVVVGALVSRGAALAGILLFVGGWGVALPAAARAAVVRSTNDALARDFAEPDVDASPWTAVALAAMVPPEPVAAALAPPSRPGPPVDPSLPAAVIPVEHWGNG